MRMTKKVLSVVLSVLMVVSMMAVMAVSANAADPVCILDDTTQYTSVNDACKAIADNATHTIKLLADSTSTKNIGLYQGSWSNRTGGKNVVLDLNGFTYTQNNTNGTGAFVLAPASDWSEGSSLTVTDTSAAKNGKITSNTQYCTIISGSMCTFTLEKGTIENTGGGSALDISGSGAATLKGGTLDADYGVSMYPASGNNTPALTVQGATIDADYGIWTSNEEDGSGNVTQYCESTVNIKSGTIDASYGVVQYDKGTVNVTGGTIDADYPFYSEEEEGSEINVTGGTFSEDVTDYVDTSVYKVKYTNAAGKVSYKTNIDYSNVGSSGTYQLLGDLTANSRIVPGLFASNVVFDLNGFTLTSTATDEAFLFSRAGSAATHNSYTIKNGTVVAAGDGVDLLANNADLTLENVDIVANGVFGVVTNGTKTGNNITATGSSITAETLGIYKPSNGSLTLTNTDVTGKTAVYVKSGDVTIDGGTFTGTGDAADYAYNGDGANITGDAVVIDSCGYPGGAPTVSIVDGTFVSDNGKAVASYVKQDDPTQTGSYEQVDGFIEGGEFSSNVSALVVPGKMAVNNGTSVDAPFVISTATLQDVADTEITECDLTGLTFVDGTGYVDDITTCNANLLGVQVRKAPPQDKTYDEGDGTRALRYVAAVKKDFLEGLTNYGFEVTVDNTTVYKSCKDTYNNVIRSGEDDDYEYFTFAIYNITKTAKPINVKFVLKGANNAEAFAFYKTQSASDNYTISASYDKIAG